MISEVDYFDQHRLYFKNLIFPPQTTWIVLKQLELFLKQPGLGQFGP